MVGRRKAYYSVGGQSDDDEAVVAVVLGGEREACRACVVIYVWGVMGGQTDGDESKPGQSKHLYRSPRMRALHMLHRAACV